MTTTNQLSHPRATPTSTALMDLMRTINESYCNYDYQSRRARLKARIERGESLGPIHYGYRKASTRAKRAGNGFARSDPRTAPLVQWAFEAFAATDCSVAQLRANLAAHTASVSPRRAPKLPSYQRLRAMLQDPFYVGAVRFDGAEHPGAHEPLVTPELFARVQARLSRPRTNVAPSRTDPVHADE